MCLTFFSCSQEKLNFTCLRKSFDQMLDPQVFQHCALLRTVKRSQPSFKHHGREKNNFPEHHMHAPLNYLAGDTLGKGTWNEPPLASHVIRCRHYCSSSIACTSVRGSDLCKVAHETAAQNHTAKQREFSDLYVTASYCDWAALLGLFMLW